MKSVSRSGRKPCPLNLPLSLLEMAALTDITVRHQGQIRGPEINLETPHSPALATQSCLYKEEDLKNRSLLVLIARTVFRLRAVEDMALVAEATTCPVGDILLGVVSVPGVPHRLMDIQVAVDSPQI